MPKRYIVQLSEAEQQSLKELVSTGKAAAYKIKTCQPSVEYRCQWTRMDRRRSGNRPELPSPDRRQPAPTLGRARLRGGVEPQATSDATAPVRL